MSGSFRSSPGATRDPLPDGHSRIGETADAPVGESRSGAVCLLSPDASSRLEQLMSRWAREHQVELVVDRRRRDRRQGGERRAQAWPPEESLAPANLAERRKIRHGAGRRVAEQRATLIPVVEPARLPRRAAPDAEKIMFVERLNIDREHREDVDTARMVTRIQAGEQQLFAELYARYFDRVYGYLRVALHDRHEAEDATQQIFLQVMEALARYELREVPFRAWLFRIVRNHTLNQLSRLGRLEPEDPSELDRRRELDDQAGHIETLNWLTDTDLVILVGRLPLAQRQVIMLRYMMDLSWSQIGEILGRSPAAVRQLQARALSQLRSRLNATSQDAHTGTRMPMARRRGLLPVIQARRRVLLAA